MASLYERISKGKISVDEITASMKRSTSKGGKYFESMQKQSKTFSGQLSTLKDNCQQFLGTLTKGVFTKLAENVLPRINKVITKLSETFEKGGLSALLDEFGVVGDVIQDVIDKFKEIAKNKTKVENLKKVFKSLKRVCETVVKIAGDLVNKFLDFATAESTLNAVEKILDGINSALIWCEDNWELVKTAIVGVVGVIAGLKLAGFIDDLTTALTKAELLKTELTGLQSLQLAVGVTLAITGLVMEGKGIADTIKEGLNLNNLGEILGGGGSLVAGAAMIGKAFGKALLGGCVGSIVAGAGMMFAGIWDSIKNGIDWLSGLLTSVGGTLMGAGIGGLIGSIGGPMGALIGFLVSGVINFIIWFWQKFEKIESWFKKLPVWGKAAIVALINMIPIGTLVTAVITIIKKWDVIVEWCKNACSKIGEFFSKMGSWINTNVIQPVKNFFIDLWNGITDGASSAWSGICSFFSTIGAWVNSNIIQPVKNFFVGLWTGIKNGAISAWNGICSFFSTIATWINTNIIQPVKNFFLNFFYFTVGLAVTIWEGIKAIIMPIASWVNTNIIQPVVNFFVNLWTRIVTIARNIWTGICTTWSTIATWVNTNVIQPVVNFFVNLWTRITSIVRNVWTSICTIWNQIPQWISTYVVQPVVNFFVNLWQRITTIVRNVWNSICTIWGIIASWVNSNIIQPVINFFVNLWTRITTIVRNVWNSICQIWGQIANWVNSNIIEPIKNFFSGLWSSITETVSSVKEAIIGAFRAAYDKVVGIWEGITGFFSGIWDGIKNTVNKLISKGKEALGVESDVKSKDDGAHHAWGGLMTTPHWGQVAEDGAEMIIPLSKDKRGRGLSLWRQAGEIMGVNQTQPSQIAVSSSLPSYSPESTVNSYYTNKSTVEHNEYSPQLSFSITGTNDERVLMRKIKRVVQEAIADTVEGIERSNPKLREV